MSVGTSAFTEGAVVEDAVEGNVTQVHSVVVDDRQDVGALKGRLRDDVVSQRNRFARQTVKLSITHIWSDLELSDTRTCVG